MSQRYRRVAFADFMRDAARIFDGIEARGETILVERGGKTFVVTAWESHRRRTPAKPQPPNMQDSLWTMGATTGRASAPAEPSTDAAAIPNGAAEAQIETESSRSRSGDGSKPPSQA